MSQARIAALALVVPTMTAPSPSSAPCCGFGWSRTSPDRPDGTPKRWVTVEPPGGGLRLVLAQAETPAQAAAIGNQCGGRVFLFLQTDDFARDQAALLAAGIWFEEQPRREPYGTVAVWRDPWGNRWDLIQPAARPNDSGPVALLSPTCRS